MTSILLRSMETQATGVERPIKCSVTTTETGAATPQGFGIKRQYRTQAVLSVDFWALDGQLNAAQEHALTAINHVIHKDVLSSLAALQSAIFGDDREEALRIISEIKDAIDI